MVLRAGRSADSLSARTSRAPIPLARLSFRRESHHDIKASRELANSRGFHRREVNCHRLARFRIFDPFVNAVAFVVGLALDVTLRSPFLPAFHFDRKMDVARAAG